MRPPTGPTTPGGRVSDQIIDQTPKSRIEAKAVEQGEAPGPPPPPPTEEQKEAARVEMPQDFDQVVGEQNEETRLFLEENAQDITPKNAKNVVSTLRAIKDIPDNGGEEKSILQQAWDIGAGAIKTYSLTSQGFENSERGVDRAEYYKDRWGAGDSPLIRDQLNALSQREGLDLEEARKMLPDGTAAYVANATAEIAASMTPALPLAAIGMIGGGLIGGAPGAGVGASVGFGVGSKGMIFNDAYMEMYGMRDDDGKIIPEKDVTVMAHVISTAGAALESVGALAAGGGFLAKTGGGKVLVEGVSGLLDRAGKKKLLSSVGSMGASSKNIVKKLAHAVAKDPVLRGKVLAFGRGAGVFTGGVAAETATEIGQQFIQNVGGEYARNGGDIEGALRDGTAKTQGELEELSKKVATGTAGIGVLFKGARMTGSLAYKRGMKRIDPQMRVEATSGLVKKLETLETVLGESDLPPSKLRTLVKKAVGRTKTFVVNTQSLKASLKEASSDVKYSLLGDKADELLEQDLDVEVNVADYADAKLAAKTDEDNQALDDVKINAAPYAGGETSATIAERIAEALRDAKPKEGEGKAEEKGPTTDDVTEVSKALFNEDYGMDAPVDTKLKEEVDAEIKETADEAARLAAEEKKRAESLLGKTKKAVGIKEKPAKPKKRKTASERVAEKREKTPDPTPEAPAPAAEPDATTANADDLRVKRESAEFLLEKLKEANTLAGDFEKERERRLFLGRHLRNPILELFDEDVGKTMSINEAHELVDDIIVILMNTFSYIAESHGMDIKEYLEATNVSIKEGFKEGIKGAYTPVFREGYNLTGHLIEITGLLGRELDTGKGVEGKVDTLMHELAHLVLTEMSVLYDKGKLTGRHRDDYLAIKSWLKIPDDGSPRETWDSEKTQERFAEGMQEFFIEGNAPKGMEAVFSRISDRIASLYKALIEIFEKWFLLEPAEVVRAANGRRSLDVDMTPEIRRVFSNIIGFQQEIETVTQHNHIFTTSDTIEKMGVVGKSAEKLKDVIEEVKSKATRSYVKKAIDAEKKRSGKEWKALVKQFKDKWMREVGMLSPAYRSFYNLSRGQNPDGTPADTPIKVSKESLMGMLSEGERTAYGRPPYLYTTKPGGVDVETAAKIFGFKNAREMIDSWAQMVPINDAQEMWAQKQTEKILGKPLSDEEISRAVGEAFTAEDEVKISVQTILTLMQMYPKEAKRIVQEMTRGRPTTKAMVLHAEKVISTLPVNVATPTAFDAIIRREGRAAEKALRRGDAEGAIRAKYRQAQAAASKAYAAKSRKARDATLARTKKMGVKSFEKKLGLVSPRARDAILLLAKAIRVGGTDLLSRADADTIYRGWQVEWGKMGSLPPVSRELFVEIVTTQGAGIREYQGRIVQALDESTKELVKVANHLSKRKKHYEGKDMAKRRAELGKSISRRAGKQRPTHRIVMVDGVRTARPIKERPFLDKLEWWNNGLTRAIHMARILDGGAHDGMAMRMIYNPIANALEVKKREDNTEVENRDNILLTFFTANELKKMKKQSFYVDHKGEPLTAFGERRNFTHMELFTIVLNWGNPRNRELIMKQYGFKDESVFDSIMDKLNSIKPEITKKEIQKRSKQGMPAFKGGRDRHILAAQSLSKRLDVRFDLLSNVENEISGRKLKKIEAGSFSYKGKTVNGWYFPISYDRKQLADKFAERGWDGKGDRLNALGIGDPSVAHESIMTQDGHTQERTKFEGVDLSTDGLSTFNHAIGEFINREVMTLPAIEVAETIGNPAIGAAIDGSLGNGAHEQLMNWVSRTVHGRRQERFQMWEKAISPLRSNVTLGLMGFNIRVAFTQIGGFTVIAHEFGPMKAAGLLLDIVTSPKQHAQEWADIKEADHTMKNRASTFDRDFQADVDLIQDKMPLSKGVNRVLESAFENHNQVKKWVKQTAFSPIGFADGFVSYASYRLGYERAMEEMRGDNQFYDSDGNVTEEAVLRAQEAGRNAVSSTQGGGDVHDLSRIQAGNELSKLATMFYTYFAVIYGRTRESKTKVRLTEGNWNKAKEAANAAMWLYVAPAMVEQAIRMDWYDPEEDESFSSWFAETMMGYSLALIPVFGRGLSSVLLDYRYNFSPVFSYLESLMGTVKEVKESATDPHGKLSDAAIIAQSRNTEKSLTLIFGVPEQVWRTKKAIETYMATGDIKAAAEVFYGRRKKRDVVKPVTSD